MTRELSDEQIDTLVARAIARNGDNTILLDIKEQLGEIGAGVKHMQSRIAAMEPTLWKLEAQRLKDEGKNEERRKLVGGVLKLRHAIYAAIVTALAYVGIHLPAWPPKLP